MDQPRGRSGRRDRRRAAVLTLAALAAFTVAPAACSSPGAALPTPGTVPPVVDSSGCGRTLAVGAVTPGHVQGRSLDAGGVSGSYLLSVPGRYRPHRPVPLIVLFHGFGSSPAQFSALTGLPARGARAGYLVAVPHTQGHESGWQVDGHGTDAAFTSGLIAALERIYCVDRAAVFAAGFSAGAAFTIAYSCAHQSQIAAIATVAVDFQLGCRRPLSIIAFHGTADPLVPYQNGAIGLSLPGIKVRGTELNMGDWARLDHCRNAPHREQIGSQVVRQQWVGCAPGTAVALYTVVGGGHSWPGADPAKALGLTTSQVDATQRILSFFSRPGTRAPAATLSG